MKLGDPTPPQVSAMRTVAAHCDSEGTYMPFADVARSYAAAADKGLLVRRKVDDGWKHNGYALTDKGKAYLKDHPT